MIYCNKKQNYNYYNYSCLTSVKKQLNKIAEYKNRSWKWICGIKDFGHDCIHTTMYLFNVVAFVSLSLKFLPSAKSTLHPRVLSIAHTAMTSPMIYVHQLLNSIFPSISLTFANQSKIMQKQPLKVNYTSLLLVGIVEELAFRAIIQNVVLTQILKYIVKKISPNHFNKIDNQIVKMIRVILTATLFAIAHGHTHGHENGLLTPQFAGGFYLSYCYENQSSLSELIISHSVYNMLVHTMYGITGNYTKLSNM